MRLQIVVLLFLCVHFHGVLLQSESDSEEEDVGEIDLSTLNIDLNALMQNGNLISILAAIRGDDLSLSLSNIFSVDYDINWICFDVLWLRSWIFEEFFTESTTKKNLLKRYTARILIHWVNLRTNTNKIISSVNSDIFSPVLMKFT